MTARQVIAAEDRMFSISNDDLWPRDLEHRYRIYAFTDDSHDVLACCATAAAIGVALVTLHEDEKARGARLADLGRIGVLDTCPGGALAPEGEWVVLPFDRR